VNYGHAVNSLDMSVTATQRGENFSIPSQPFMFSAVLTGLDPGVTYYYHVEARNSVGPTQSAVQHFTSNELRKYMSYYLSNVWYLCIIMSVYTKFFEASMGHLYCGWLLPPHVLSPSSSNYVELCDHA